MEASAPVRHAVLAARNGPMNAWWTSRIGWALVATYLVVAGILFHQALTCRGWVCDLVALPAALPLGLPISWLIDRVDWFVPIPGHTPTFPLRHWYFIIPTVSANAWLYYWVGRQFEMLGRRLLQRSARRR